MEEDNKEEDNFFKIFWKNHSQRVLLFFGAIAIYLAFHDPITNVLACIFTDGFLDDVNRGFPLDIIVLLALLIPFIISPNKRVRDYRPSTTVNIIALISCSIYIFERFFNNRWEFTSLKSISDIKYFDALIVLGITQFWLNRTRFKKFNIPKEFFNENGEKIEKEFFEDQPLDVENQKELLGYASYSSKIVRKILAHQISEKGHPSFAIGINGKWGVGKTSFVKLIKKELVKHHKDANTLIQIDYHPWNSDSPESIILDFFETLNEELEKYDSGISRKLKRYSHKLTRGNSNNTSQWIQSITNLVSGDNSIKSLHDAIDKSLKYLGKRVIVFIDDLDRLDKKEVTEVIRLIRNTASFKNTFFVVAYDREYVITALNELNENDNHVYLEKIFQIELNLPKFNASVLRNKLFDYLVDAFPEYEKELHHELVSNVFKEEPNYLDKIIETPRDVVRLANSIMINFPKQILGDVEIGDVIRIESVRIKFPKVYDLLAQDYERILVNTRTNNNDDNILSLKMESSENQHPEKPRYLIHSLLEEAAFISIPSYQIEKIVSFLVEVFKVRPSPRSFAPSPIAINVPSSYNRYFSYSLRPDEISQIDFSKTRQGSFTLFKAQIDIWMMQEMDNEIQKKFQENKWFDNLEDYEKFMMGYRYFGHKLSIDRSRSVLQNSIIIKDFIDIVLKYEEITNPNKSNEAHKDFLIQLFDTADPPYLFESELLHEVEMYKRENISKFPLSKEERAYACVNYLRKYCQQVSKLDDNVFQLLFNCRYGKSSEALNRNELTPKAKEVFVNFVIEKDFLGFLDYVVEPDKKRSEGFFRLSDFLLDIFDSMDDFLSLVINYRARNEHQSAALNEFIEFFNLIPDHKLAHPLEYSFEHLSVTNRIVNRHSDPLHPW